MVFFINSSCSRLLLVQQGNLLRKAAASFLSSSSSLASRSTANLILSSSQLLNNNRLLGLTCTRKQRLFSTTPKLKADDEKIKEPTEGELKIKEILRKNFPRASAIDVQDISGGCGSMYEIYVESVEFKGMRTVKQHQLINDALKKEITQNMHGLRIFTALPEQ